MVDARLPDGSRVNAVIPPLSLDGPALTIRRFSGAPLTGDDLVAPRDDRRRACSICCARRCGPGATCS